MYSPASFRSRQTQAWPIKNKTPRPVAEVHHQLKALRLPALMARRAFSMTALETRSTPVLSQRIFGLGVLTQSGAPLRRIKNAAVNARKTTELETSNRQSPISDARREAPRPSLGPSPPLPQSAGGGGGGP